MVSPNRPEAGSRLLPIKHFEKAGDFDFWRAIGAHVCDISPIQASGNTGTFKARQFYFEGGFFGQTHYDSQAVKHSAKHVDQIGNTLRVQRFLKGGMIGRSGDTPFEFRPGMISIMDQALMFETLHDASIAQGIYIPKTLPGLDRPDPVQPIRFHPDTPIARLFHTQMDRMLNPVLDGSRVLASETYERLLAITKIAIEGPDQNEDVRRRARAALRDMICESIERDLASPTLSVSSILKTFGVSRASLYRMFEPDGGVRQYISQRRLFRAVADLSINPFRRGQISATAEFWGFSSDANFNRAVKRVFGTSPGNLFQNSFSHFESLAISTAPVRFSTFADFLSDPRLNRRETSIRHGGTHGQNFSGVS